MFGWKTRNTITALNSRTFPRLFWIMHEWRYTKFGSKHLQTVHERPQLGVKGASEDPRLSLVDSSRLPTRRHRIWSSWGITDGRHGATANQLGPTTGLEPAPAHLRPPSRLPYRSNIWRHALLHALKWRDLYVQHEHKTQLFVHLTYFGMMND